MSFSGWRRRVLFAAHGDIAFWDDIAVVSQFHFDDGSTDGFSVVDTSNPTQPREISRLRCSGSGWDVSIVSIADPARPVQVGSVAARDGFRRVVRVNLRGVRAGAYTVRVSYRDRSGRRRSLRRTVTSCG